MPITKTIRVDLPGRAYEVAVGTDLLAEAGRRIAARAARAVIVTDSNVGPLVAAALVEAVVAAGAATEVIEFTAGEAHKNLDTYRDVMDRLLGLSDPPDRATLLVACGGGVVGDLAGFVAATALRGLDFVNVPTTLLADVDASVGGKTGVDAPAGKNLIGAFHQPKEVIIDAAVLKTLPDAELGNGLAECVKHAVIRDAGLLDFIVENAQAFRERRAAALADLIARNVAIKAAVVAADEREAGQRAHLNLGHTFGHAIEAAAGYTLGHGACVSLGLVAACGIAAGRGLIAPADADRVRDALAALDLPVRFDDAPSLPAEAKDTNRLREIMAHDKKARAGVVRFILPTALGAAEVFDDVTDAEVRAAVAALDG